MIDRSKRSTSIGTLIENDQGPPSECALWRSVIATAITDAFDRKPSRRLAVVRWLESDDFTAVCEFAGLNPEGLLPRMLYLLDDSAPLVLRKKAGRELRNAIMRVGLNKTREGARLSEAAE